ncbi:MAG TPA: hypothetical protein VJZ06_01830 [Mobilitalea sp.]|nr:hypothetical protein [Mobilitalea sp.]
MPIATFVEMLENGIMEDTMVCPNCQSNMSDKRKRCEYCGTDLTLYKKILRSSNLYYNNGLARAKVRDLSGAEIALRNSLELNKANTNARNLLGLIYFEMGETVAALSEWVISRHFHPDDNDADEYINAVQSNPTKLDSLNQAIKRYNTALEYSIHGSEDLAVIQLKKVIVLNPRFIRAYHLLALLYMKAGDNEKAKRCLIRAARIDCSNTTTLRYLRELEPAPTLLNDAEGGADADKNLASSIMPVSSYREDKPNIMAFINLVIGVVIGLAVMAILVIPSLNKNDTTKDNQDYVDQSSGLIALEAKEETIIALQQDNQELEQKVTQLQTQIDSIVIPEVNPGLYDAILSAADMYLVELAKPENERVLTEIADTLQAIDVNEYESEPSKVLLDHLKTEIYPVAAAEHYDIGHNLYGDYKYEEALVELHKAYAFDPLDVSTIYFIARSYHRLDDYEKASLYYTIITTDFVDSKRYDDSIDYLEQLPDGE